MRRTLATVILGPSLLLASVAWSAFGLLNTVLNPDRSEKVASALLDDPLVQQQLRTTVAEAVGSQLPDAVPVSDEALETGAGVALDNPVVETVIRDALVQAHQAFLGEAEVPSEIDLGSAADDVRANTLAGVPGADTLLPESPPLIIDLPTQNIPNLGGFRRWLARVAPLLAIAAAAGVGLALLTTTNRPAVLRRAGFWAMGASAIWLVLNLLIPWAATQWFSGQAAIAASLVDAMFGEMLRPALVLAGLGVGLFVASLVVPAARRTGGPDRSDGGVIMRKSAEPSPGLPTPLYEVPTRAPRTAQPFAQPAPPPTPTPTPAPFAAPVATPPIVTTPPPAAAAPKPPVEQPWVPGVGYVEPGEAPVAAPEEPPPEPAPRKPEPTWIPGVGYVDENPGSGSNEP